MNEKAASECRSEISIGKVRTGSAVKGLVLVVVWPVTGLAGGAEPLRAPVKYGGSTQGPSHWSRGGAGNSVRSHDGWAACGGGATHDREAAGRGRGSPRGSRPRHLLPGSFPISWHQEFGFALVSYKKARAFLRPFLTK